MKRVYISLICIVLVFSVLLTACSGGEIVPGNADIINVSLGSEPESLDPAYCTDAAAGSIILHIFEGLMVLGKNGTPEYAQAESCDISNDGLTYTFKLREGLKWSDGRGVSAGDYSYAWGRAASVPENKGSAYLFDNISKTNNSLNIETPDDLTLIVKLKKPSAYFMELLTLPAFCPVRRDAVSNASNWSMKSGTCIGNGAYTLKTVVENSYIGLEKNDNYRAASAVKTKTLNFVNVTGGTTYDAFIGGDILFADTLPASKLEEAKKLEAFHREQQYGTYYVLFNTASEPFENPLVREALSLAIDREALNKNICLSTNTAAGALVPPGVLKNGSFDYRSTHSEFIDTKNHSMNVERAKELLEEAGYPEGKNLPPIEYSCTPGSEHLLIAEALQHMWADLGVIVSIKELEWNALLKDGTSGSFQLIRSGWMFDYDDPLSVLSVFTSDSARNFSGWSDENYDEYIADSYKETDINTRTELLYKAEEILFDNWVVCPLFYYSDIYLQSDYLEGVVSSPLGYKSFVNAKIVLSD